MSPVPHFSDWISERLGTRQWVVAARLTKSLQAKGYDRAVTQQQFAVLTAEHAELEKIDRAERIARRLFPEDIHDDADCLGEIGREGQPCRICADNLDRWRSRVKAVHEALKAEA